MNLEDIEKDFNLKPIKVNNKKVNLLDNVYSVGYCYFDLFDILDFENPIVHVKIIFIFFRKELFRRKFTSKLPLKNMKLYIK